MLWESKVQRSIGWVGGTKDICQPFFGKNLSKRLCANDSNDADVARGKPSVHTTIEEDRSTRRLFATTTQRAHEGILV